MLCIKEAILVEGRYDKNTLSQVVNAVILESAGFGIFKDEQLLALLRRLARTQGLIVLTDGDGAGFVIRNYIKGSIDPALVKHAYIPDVAGKEPRKRTPGKEGKVGVEGMSPQVLEAALRRAGATVLAEDAPHRETVPVTRTDFMLWGLSGRPDSAARREALLEQLDLPRRMTTKALLPVLNALYGREEVEALLDP